MSLPMVAVAETVSRVRTLSAGDKDIAGVTKVDGNPTPCRVFLHRQSDDIVTGYRRSNTAGEYSFEGLAEDDYYLVILDDRQGTRRAKVEHVRL